MVAKAMMVDMKFAPKKIYLCFELSLILKMVFKE